MFFSITICSGSDSVANSMLADPMCDLIIYLVYFLTSGQIYRFTGSTMRNARKVLESDGRAILVELTWERMTALTIFGTLPGPWADQEEGGQSGAPWTGQEWETTLLKTGFSELDAAVWD